MSEQNTALVRSLYEAFNRGDADTVLAAFDENIDWYEAEGMPYGGHHQGPQAVAENVFGPIVGDVDNFQVTPEEIYDGGDEEVIVICTYSGSGHESGKEFSLQGAHTWTVRDGKITRFRQLMDTVKFNEALAVGAPA